MKRTLEQHAFARGYGAALHHILGLEHQHWPAEGKPSIEKLMAQIRNCFAQKHQIAAVGNSLLAQDDKPCCMGYFCDACGECLECKMCKCERGK